MKIPRADWLENKAKTEKMVFALIAALFSFSVLFQLHGFSIASLNARLSSKEKVASIGRARDLRSDDWALDLPIILSQLSSPDRFAAHNPLIATGENVLIPFRVPSKHWVSVFRPATWGFFISADTGLAWLWSYLSLGNFLAMFLVLGALFQLPQGTRILLSTLYLFSPYLQFWSFHTAEIYLHGLLAVFFTVLTLRSTQVLLLAGCLLGLFWSAVSMVLGYMYPTRIIPTTLALALVFAGFCLQNKTEIFSRQKLVRWLGILASVGSAGLAIALFIRDQSPFVELIQNTIYPGKDFRPGGAMPWSTHFHNWFFAQASSKFDSVLGNKCENASFFLTWPMTAGILGYLAFNKKIKTPWIAIGGLVAIAIFALYAHLGFPDWLTRILLFNKVRATRLQIGVGIADLFVLAALLDFWSKEKFALPMNIRRILLALWTILMVTTASGLLSQLEKTSMIGLLVPGLLLSLGLAVLFIVKNRIDAFLKAIVVVSIASTIWWNPWVRGGTQAVWKSDIAQAILKTTAASETKGYWVVIGDTVVANLPRIIGVPSLTGYHLYPDFKLWKKIDPLGAKYDVYNRSGYVSFDFSPELQSDLMNEGLGHIKVMAPLRRDFFTNLGVNYILVANKPEFTEMALKATSGKFVYRDERFLIIRTEDLKEYALSKRN